MLIRWAWIPPIWYHIGVHNSESLLKFLLISLKNLCCDY